MSGVPYGLSIVNSICFFNFRNIYILLPKKLMLISYYAEGKKFNGKDKCLKLTVDCVGVFCFFFSIYPLSCTKYNFFCIRSKYRHTHRDKRLKKNSNILEAYHQNEDVIRPSTCLL